MVRPVMVLRIFRTLSSMVVSVLTLYTGVAR